MLRGKETGKVSSSGMQKNGPNSNVFKIKHDNNTMNILTTYSQKFNNTSGAALFDRNPTRISNAFYRKKQAPFV
jgi:hypothetical protein